MAHRAEFLAPRIAGRSNEMTAAAHIKRECVRVPMWRIYDRQNSDMLNLTNLWYIP